MEKTTDLVAEFTRYYEEYKHGVFNYILYRVSYNRDLAEDLTSDIFIKAYEHLDSFDRSRSFKTWIFTIAHNHLINYLTGNKQPLQLDDNLAANLEDQTEKYDEAFDQKMIVDKLGDLMKELPESQRELLTMRFVNDLSNSEIAEVLSKDEGAVRTGLSRAIGALRNKYVASVANTPMHEDFQEIHDA